MPTSTKMLKHYLRVILVLAAALGPNMTPALQAQTAATQSADSDLQAIQQFINPTTILLAQFDLQRLAPPAATRGEATLDKDLQAWIAKLQSTFEPLANERVTMMVDVPSSAAQIPVRFLAKKPLKLELDQLNKILASNRFSPALIEGDTVATAPAGLLADSSKIVVDANTLASNDTNLLAASSSVRGMPIQLVFAPPNYIRSTYAELMPRLPERWGGTTTTTLTEGVQWAAFGIDPGSMKARIIIQSQSKTAADRLAAELPRIAKVIADRVPAEHAQAALELLTTSGNLVVNNDRIEISITNFQALRNSSPAGAQLLNLMVDPLRAHEKMMRFKRIAEAIHKYEVAFGVFPPAKEHRRADGKSNLSWRVHILPYLGEEKLYSEFKLNEPWDSEHNVQLLSKIPAIYSNDPVLFASNSGQRGFTTILAPVGEGTIFGGTSPVGYKHIEDGTSITISFVEVKPDHAQLWTVPGDYEFPMSNPGKGLAIGPDGQFLAAKADGSVALLPGNLPKETLIHLFQMNDGKAISIEASGQ